MKKMNIQSFALYLTGIGALTACGHSAPNGEQRAESYKTLKVTPQSITLYNDYPAQLEGKENIEIRPMIEGFVDQVLIDEGEYVRKGQLLFVLKAPQYEQNVRNAKAVVASAEAEINSAEVEVEKARPLVEEGIVSKFQLVSAENTLKVQQAALAQAKADLINAQINLGYAQITAPVAGMVGTLPYKLGSLVSSTTTNPLTTISNIDQVYAYFSINEKTQLAFVKNAEGKTIDEKLKSLPDVLLLLPDNSLYDHTGRIETISGQVDEETGSFNVRAVFSNPEGILRTGNSATLRIPNQKKDALIIPQAATYEIQGNTFAYVLQDSVTVKSVKLEVTATPSGQAYVVLSGLKANDQVVIEGINALSDGDQIKPVLTPADSIQALQNPAE